MGNSVFVKVERYGYDRELLLLPLLLQHLSASLLYSNGRTHVLIPQKQIVPTYVKVCRSFRSSSHCHRQYDAHHTTDPEPH